eukprot:scaffold47670_cov45-Phaeocystis_antarctica.AAC.1
MRGSRVRRGDTRQQHCESPDEPATSGWAGRALARAGVLACGEPGERRQRSGLSPSPCPGVRWCEVLRRCCWYGAMIGWV